MNKSTTACILKPQSYFLKFSSETWGNHIALENVYHLKVY